MTRLLFALAFCLSTALLSAQSSHAASRAHQHAFPVTVVDDHGFRIHLTRAPSRILSLDPRDTETLFALGLERKLVGDGSKFSEGATGIVTSAGKPRDFRYPSEWPSRLGRDYPIKAPQLTHIEGGYQGSDFNVEAIVQLQPQLVIASYSKSEESTFAQMRSVGLKVMVLDPSNLKSILHDIALVGKATGTSTQARQVVGTMTGQLASLRTSLAHVHSHPRVYYEVDGTNPTEPYTAGPGTFIDNGIHLVKGTNVADTVKSCSGTLCYPQFNLEALVQLNPQVIVLGDAAYGESPAKVKARSGWQTIDAVRTGRIYPFDDDLISRAGPRIIAGLRELARIVHPKAFHGK